MSLHMGSMFQCIKLVLMFSVSGTQDAAGSCALLQ